MGHREGKHLCWVKNSHKDKDSPKQVRETPCIHAFIILFIERNLFHPCICNTVDKHPYYVTETSAGHAALPPLYQEDFRYKNLVPYSNIESDTTDGIS